MHILIADDHDLLRDTLELWFRQENIAVTLACDLDSALALAVSSEPFDVILLDYDMPGMNGLEGLRRILDAVASSRVALMSGNAERRVAEEALEMGAVGFLPKTLAAKSLVNAVRFMAMGEQYAPVEFMTGTPEAAPVNPLIGKLTTREVDVLAGLCEGKANKAIARDLGIQEPTVKLHMKTLYRKLGVNNRTQAAMVAKQEGLF